MTFDFWAGPHWAGIHYTGIQWIDEALEEAVRRPRRHPSLRFIPVVIGRARVTDTRDPVLPEVWPVTAVGVIRIPIVGCAELVCGPTLEILPCEALRAAGRSLAVLVSAPAARLVGSDCVVPAIGHVENLPETEEASDPAGPTDEELFLLILAARSQTRRARLTAARR